MNKPTPGHPPPARRLDDTWLKAAALGCLWASAEIVLGGFLHNLRIPMAGNLLAGIGIVLMIAVGHLWPVRGLYWRAGLVCALMKALAPSAVVLGPMIAITCQACLMEAAVRLFRRNVFSCLLGAMLAMSWNIAQFSLNILVSYGSGIVDVYRGLVRWSGKMLGLGPGGSWLPLLLLLTVNLAAGLVAGLLGLFIGRRAAGESLEMSSLSTDQVMYIRAAQPAREFPYSLPWLAADLAMLVAVLVSTGLAPWHVWLPAGLVAMTVWLRRYRDAVRPLLRPGFWIGFVVLTGLSAALFASLKSGWRGLLGGIGDGLAMNFRAAVLVVGFTALGMELRSPLLGRGLSRGRFHQLPAALEAAVDTLPLVMANLPRLQEAFRRPVTIFHRVVCQADFWLKRLTLRQARRGNVLLLSGSIGAGKSHTLARLLDDLRADGRRVAGILSPSVHRDGRRIGYDLIDVSDNRRTELSRIAVASPAAGSSPSVGNYHFLPQGLCAGQAALAMERAAGADMVMVDEVGPWELRDQGWAAPLYDLTLHTDVPMVWVVRSDIVDQVCAHWALYEPRILDLGQLGPAQVVHSVRQWLDERRERAASAGARLSAPPAAGGCPAAPHTAAAEGSLPAGRRP